MGIVVRGDLPIATITFDSILPDRNETIEAVRIQTSLAHVKKMIEAFSRVIQNIEAPKSSAS